MLVKMLFIIPRSNNIFLKIFDISKWESSNGQEGLCTSYLCHAAFIIKESRAPTLVKTRSHKALTCDSATPEFRNVLELEHKIRGKQTHRVLRLTYSCSCCQIITRTDQTFWPIEKTTVTNRGREGGGGDKCPTMTHFTHLDAFQRIDKNRMCLYQKVMFEKQTFPDEA